MRFDYVNEWFVHPPGSDHTNRQFVYFGFETARIVDGLPNPLSKEVLESTLELGDG